MANFSGHLVHAPLGEALEPYAWTKPVSGSAEGDERVRCPRGARLRPLANAAGCLKGPSVGTGSD